MKLPSIFIILIISTINIVKSSSSSSTSSFDSKYVSLAYYSKSDTKCSNNLLSNLYIVNGYCKDHLSWECSKENNTLSVNYWGAEDCTSLLSTKTYPLDTCITNCNDGDCRIFTPSIASCVDQIELPTSNAIMNFYTEGQNNCDYKNQFKVVSFQKTNTCLLDNVTAYATCNTTFSTWSFYKNQDSCNGTPTQIDQAPILNCFSNPDNTTITNICV